MNQNTNYSTLKLYKTDILTIDKNSMFSANANVSNFVAYLNTCWKETIDYFQYQKSLGMNLTIKLNKSQDYINLIDDADDYPYNYVSIKNYGDDRTFYYFITDFIIWRSKNTIELTLALDTIATYWDQLKFDDRTLVHREHTDRFIVPDTISIGTRKLCSSTITATYFKSMRRSFKTSYSLFSMLILASNIEFSGMLGKDISWENLEL